MPVDEPERKELHLLSSDEQVFIVDPKSALMSETIRNFMEDTGTEDYIHIPLPNVCGTILAKVIEYCNFHTEASKNDVDKPAKSEDEVKDFDAGFVNVDQSTLFDIILAANYLNIKSLLDLTCQTVANMIKGKTPEEIRKQFDIKNDFTPEEEEENVRDNQWAFH